MTNYAGGCHNDPPRSRLMEGFALLINTSVGWVGTLSHRISRS